MSKSLGNFFTVHDLLEQGVPGEVIRFVFLSTHYRKPMDWTAEKAREAEATLRKWRQLTENVEVGEVSKDVVDLLAQDLNTPGAISKLHALASRPFSSAFSSGFDKSKQDLPSLKASAQFIGLLTPEMGDWDWRPKIHSATVSISAKSNIKAHASVVRTSPLGKLAARMADLRQQAMSSKDFSEVDKLKNRLLEAGVEVRITKEGVELIPSSNFDTSKLEALK